MELILIYDIVISWPKKVDVEWTDIKKSEMNKIYCRAKHLKI